MVSKKLTQGEVMNKKKVLIVHNYYKIFGGEDTVVENEKSMLEKNGHKVFLYTKNNQDINTDGILNKLKAFVNTIFSYKVYKEVKELIKREGIDIMHVHNTLLLVSPSVYYAAFNNKIPVVQTLHNFRFICPAATLARCGGICTLCPNKGMIHSLKNKCYRKSFLQTLSVYLMFKFHNIIGTYRKVNAFIALTEFNKNLFEKYSVSMRNIFVKPNFSATNIKGCSNRVIEDYFVYFGRLDEIKGVRNLLEYWSQYNDSKLVIIGSGPEENYIKKFIDENKIENIELKGFMERNQAHSILSRCKAIIIPSIWYEGFPMSIVESFFLGVPVIGSKLGNIESVIEPGYNGLLFNPNSANEFLEAIRAIDTNIEYNEKLNTGAYNTYINKYTEELNYCNLMEIYNLAKDDSCGDI
jgi:glycosyltransferase involved in cell wall biosynthesis